MKSDSQRQSAQTADYREESQFQRLMAKYQGMLLEDAQSLTRARSFAANTLSWLLIAAKALVPFVFTHMRNFYVIKQAGIIAQPIISIAMNWPLPQADSFMFFVMVAILSWLWWLCRQNIIWLVIRILL